MARCTEEELQEVMRYKAEKASTMAEDEDRNMMSIKRISSDLMNTLKKAQQYVWTDSKRKSTKNNKNFVNRDLDRNCYTQRGKSPQQNFDNAGLSQFDESQIPFNQNEHFLKGMKGFKFLQLNDVEKTEYVPMKKKLNPEQANVSKKPNVNKNAPKISKAQKEAPKKNPQQKEQKNQSAVNQSPQLKPSATLTQTRSSLTLTNPIKHVKKHILQAVQIKKQSQQRNYCMTPKHTSIKEFYQSNTDHIPLYQKSKMLNIKKLVNLEQSRMMRQSAEIQEVTFWPMINTKSEELIKGRTFYSRLEQTMNRRQANQGRIMQETMKSYTFAPKLNSNKQVESKVRRIWVENDPRRLQSSGVIEQVDEDEHLEYHKKSNNWLTIRLQKEYAEKLFID